MDGNALADAAATALVVVIVICLLIGAGLGWLLPWLWHHISFGWK